MCWILIIAASAILHRTFSHRSFSHIYISLISPPFQDGRTLGDNWLEYKGRAVPPGPEKRRGRQNLTETFQQTSNPYKVSKVGNGHSESLYEFPPDLLSLGPWA